MPKTIDIFAAEHAERTIRELLDVYEAIDTSLVAATVTDSFNIRFERRDGKRRVVLTGEWEVDPAAVAVRVPA